MKSRAIDRTGHDTTAYRSPRLGLLLVLAMLAGLLAACGTSTNSPAITGDLGGADESGADETETDAAETDAAETGGAQRIVSISPTATEVLFAIGAGDQVIAVDSLSTFPAGAPVTDLSAFEPNLEAIAAEDPDLVVLSFDPGDIVAGLEAAGIETIVQEAAVSLDDVYAQIADLGIATGQIDGAADLVAEMRSAIEAIVAASATGAEPLRVYHELDDTFYSVSSNSFVGQLYELLGVINIADEADTDGFGYPQLSAEYIIEADPQLIVIPDEVRYSAADVAARPGWDLLSAVQNDGIVVVEADIASRWGPRIVDFLEFISAAIAAQQVDA